jgi:hypothetical protein
MSVLILALPVALVGLAVALLRRVVVTAVLTPTIRVDDLPRPLPGDHAPVGAPVR